VPEPTGPRNHSMPTAVFVTKRRSPIPSSRLLRESIATLERGRGTHDLLARRSSAGESQTAPVLISEVSVSAPRHPPKPRQDPTILAVFGTVQKLNPLNAFRIATLTTLSTLLRAQVRRAETNRPCWGKTAADHFFAPPSFGSTPFRCRPPRVGGRRRRSPRGGPSYRQCQ